MSTAVVMREDILKERLKHVKEGNLLLALFNVAEELGICSEIELENAFSFPALDYVNSEMLKSSKIVIENIYKSIRNIYYVVELYLRGYYNGEHYMNYEEFLRLVMAGRSKEIIKEANSCFMLHINRLKRIIDKTKRKIPANKCYRGQISYYVENRYYRETKQLLKELDWDLTTCQKYANTSLEISEYHFGQNHGLCGPVSINKHMGFLALEETIYALYNELSILAKLDVNDIKVVCSRADRMISYNLFEKVVNNYLFAQLYSENPEKLRISTIDAKLILGEVKRGLLDADELVTDMIKRYEFTGYRAEYLQNYGNHLNKRLEGLKKSGYFAELFVVTPPE